MEYQQHINEQLEEKGNQMEMELRKERRKLLRIWDKWIWLGNGISSGINIEGNIELNDNITPESVL